MANNKTDIKLNFSPLVIIAFVILVLLLLGNGWNNKRTQDKLAKIKVHAEAIYTAHQNEFISTVKSTNKDVNGYFIDRVNLPENGIYNVRILIKDTQGNYFIRNKWGNQTINPESTIKLDSILSDNVSVSTNEDIFVNESVEKDRLFAFTPINDNGQIIGYVMVSVQKNQDL